MAAGLLVFKLRLKLGNPTRNLNWKLGIFQGSSLLRMHVCLIDDTILYYRTDGCDGRRSTSFVGFYPDSRILRSNTALILPFTLPNVMGE